MAIAPVEASIVVADGSTVPLATPKVTPVAFAGTAPALTVVPDGTGTVTFWGVTFTPTSGTSLAGARASMRATAALPAPRWRPRIAATPAGAPGPAMAAVA